MLVRSGRHLAGTHAAATPSSHHERWVEPGSDQSYPVAYREYRRVREAEDRRPARHRTFGPDIDRYLWQRHGGADAARTEVVFTVRQDTPPRVRRIIAEVLLAIRRGRPAADAIRQVSRRFGLRDARARAFIAGCIGFELRAGGATHLS
jgi:hypothetical protein